MVPVEWGIRVLFCLSLIFGRLVFVQYSLYFTSCNTNSPQGEPT